tara:strand:+ start:457 stop:738 length:282 start_codon:yes stop_codon:yes gene_type:complete
MTIDWMDIAVTISTTGFFALIGFVWRWSHKVTNMEERLNHLNGRVRKMERDHDKVMDRVYSLAKSRSEFMTKESYHRDKNIDRMMLDSRREDR